MSSWGGYVFLINLIPLHVLALMATGRFSHRIYVAYSTASRLLVYFVVLHVMTLCREPFPVLCVVVLTFSLCLSWWWCFGFCLFIGLLHWNNSVDADFLCRLPTSSVEWTYGGKQDPNVLIAVIKPSYGHWTGPVALF